MLLYGDDSDDNEVDNPTIEFITIIIIIIFDIIMYARKLHGIST